MPRKEKMRERVFEYLPKKNFLYKLNPLSKGLGIFILVLVQSLHFKGFFGSVLCIGFILFGYFSAGVSPFRAILSLRTIFIFLLVVTSLPAIERGWNGLPTGFDNFLRAAGIFLLAGLFLTLTSNGEQLYFWRKILFPLDFLGTSSRKWGMILTLSLRFLPEFLAEVERIEIAQKIRGIDFAEKGFSPLKRVRRMVSILVPTMTLAMRRSSKFAIAMEARGYDPSGSPSELKKYSFGLPDLVVLLILVGFSLFYLT